MSTSTLKSSSSSALRTQSAKCASSAGEILLSRSTRSIRRLRLSRSMRHLEGKSYPGMLAPSCGYGPAMDLAKHGDVALLRIRGTKANSMTPEMVTALGATIAKVLESDAKALVLTGEGKFFSAGLALPALVRLGRPELRVFMQTFARTMRGLFASPKPVVAAINGHAIAGGAVLALQCDVRIAAAGDQRI